MRHCAALLISLASAACASKGAPPPAEEARPTTNTTYIMAAGSGAGSPMGITTAPDARGVVATVSAPRERAWEALPAAYAAVGIDYTTLDKTRWMIGNDALKVRRRLGGVPLDRLLNCGGTSANPHAATYEVTLSVFTQLAPAGEGETNVRTTVQGSARSVSFNSEPVTCASTRGIEDRIANALTVELAKQQSKE